MLYALETERILRLTSPGRLLPWLGPALRGLAAGQFRQSVCAYSLAEQQSTWRYCKGCPHITECPYGRTIEPDPPAGMAMHGQDDAARPVVIAPAFPAPEIGEVGTELPVRVSFVGIRAAQHADEFWTALAVAGRSTRQGIAPDHTRFEVLPPPPPDSPARWRAIELPLEPVGRGTMIPRLRVALTSPLFLRPPGEEGRGLLQEPTFADLLRASLRTLGRLHAYYGETLPDQAFRDLKQAAAEIPTLDANYTTFRQRKWSNRSRQGFLLTGAIGEASFGPVPRGLAAWLAWGGRLHVGPHRVAGAGGWEVFVHER